MKQELVATAWRMTPFKASIRPVARAVRSSVWSPWNWPRTLRLLRILALEYGHLNSAAKMAAIDAAGEPLPWFTYPAIEFLSRLDLGDKSVFEYGCGNSTRYWAARAADVVSVEHVPEFFELIRPQLPPNCHLSLRRPADVYVGSLAEASASRGGFDVIIIDGHSRVRCSQTAANYLRPGGMIVLDNADWFPEAAANLRAAGLLEVSFTGFAPISDFTSTTAIFFERTFAFPLRPGSGAGIGSIPKPKFEKVL